MKKPFEAYITLIENVLEAKLFQWQKDVLLQIYNGNFGRIYFARQQGITMLDTAAVILSDAMARDMGNLPHYQYELYGYSTTVVTYDENWGENIEWEKENKYGK